MSNQAYLADKDYLMKRTEKLSRRKALKEITIDNIEVDIKQLRNELQLFNSEQVIMQIEQAKIYKDLGKEEEYKKIISEQIPLIVNNLASKQRLQDRMMRMNEQGDY